MRLILTSASATVVFTASLQPNNNVNAVLASVLDATNGSLEYVHDNYFFEECSFDASGQSSPNIDVGVLNCANPGHECVRDSTSSLGGRCTLRLDYSDGVEERKLQTCIKCQGVDACKNVPQAIIDNKIGCGSCNGANACHGLSCEYDLGKYVLFFGIMMPNCDCCFSIKPNR